MALEASHKGFRDQLQAARDPGAMLKLHRDMGAQPRPNIEQMLQCRVFLRNAVTLDPQTQNARGVPFLRPYPRSAMCTDGME